MRTKVFVPCVAAIYLNGGKLIVLLSVLIYMLVYSPGGKRIEMLLRELTISAKYVVLPQRGYTKTVILIGKLQALRFIILSP